MNPSLSVSLDHWEHPWEKNALQLLVIAFAKLCFFVSEAGYTMEENADDAWFLSIGKWLDDEKFLSLYDRWLEGRDW